MAQDDSYIKPRIMARLQNTLSWKQFQDSFDSEPQQRAGFSKSEFLLKIANSILWKIAKSFYMKNTRSLNGRLQNVSKRFL